MTNEVKDVACPLCGGPVGYLDHGVCTSCGFIWINGPDVRSGSLDSLTAEALKHPIKVPTFEQAKAARRN